MPKIKTYKDAKLAELRKKQRECMQRLRKQEQTKKLWTQRVEHKPQIVQKSRTQFYNISK